MALNEPKMRSITGKLVANKLTERDDDFSFNVTYQANRSVKDLCKLAATNSKFTASELESAYNDLMAQAKIELYNASTVEFGFANNSLGRSVYRSGCQIRSVGQQCNFTLFTPYRI